MKTHLLLAFLLVVAVAQAAAPIDTVRYTDKKGVRYVMIVVGDHVPVLYRNNQRIPQAEFDRYGEIIGILQEQLIEHWKKSKKS